MQRKFHTRQLVLAAVSLIWLVTLGSVACTQDDATPQPPPIDVVKYTQPPYVCVTPAPGTTPSWRNDVRPLLASACFDCHRPEQANGGVVLTSYNSVRPYAASVRLLGVVAHAPLYPQMPYGRPKLTDCQIGIIAAWILAGYPNN